jgi:hypothetical protein
LRLRLRRGCDKCTNNVEYSTKKEIANSLGFEKFRRRAEKRFQLRGFSGDAV